MKRVLPTDFYSSSRITLFSYIDIRMLVDLYLPLIGSKALSVFLRLQEDESSKSNEVFHHQRLFDALRLNANEFEETIRILEAVGLVKTYVSSGEGPAYFVYALFSPFSPNKFFNDPLLYGTFLKYVGEEEANRMKEKYRDRNITKGMVDISESFQNYFSPDLNEGYYGKSLGNAGLKERRYAKANIAFDRDAFEKEWKEFALPGCLLSDFEKERIEKVAVLYGIKPQLAAQLAIESFVFFDGRQTFDEDAFASRCTKSAPFDYLRQEEGKKSVISSKTQKARFARMLDTTPPAYYLAQLQGGHRPAESDLTLLWKLAMEIGLPNGVINALLSFTLQKDNTISRPYLEKVGSYLLREGCRSAIDAMECLKKMNSVLKEKARDFDSRKSDKTFYSDSKTKPVPTNNVKTDQDDKKETVLREKTDEEIDAMFDAVFLDLEKKKRKD